MEDIKETSYKNAMKLLKTDNKKKDEYLGV